jgi:hypothetical protein
MRCSAVFAIAFVSAACTVSPAPVARVRHVEPAQVAPPVASELLPDPQSPVTELTIARPEAVACALASSSWTGAVRLRDGGPTFATVQSTPSTLHVPIEGGPVIVDVTGVFDLTFVIASPSVFLARPLALGDFVVPFASTPLAVATRHTEGSLTVGLDVSDRFETPSSVTQAVSCRDLTPTVANYDALEFARMPESVDVAIEAGTELRSRPGGKSLARVRDAGGLVRFGALVNGARRIVIEGRGYLAMGWVPANRVYAPQVGYGRGVGGRGTLRWSTIPSAACKAPIPIYGQLGDERALIGRTKPGARFQRAPTEKLTVPKGFVAIAPATMWLSLAPGAMLLLHESDLTMCAPTP